MKIPVDFRLDRFDKYQLDELLVCFDRLGETCPPLFMPLARAFRLELDRRRQGQPSDLIWIEATPELSRAGLERAVFVANRSREQWTGFAMNAQTERERRFYDAAADLMRASACTLLRIAQVQTYERAAS